MAGWEDLIFIDGKTWLPIETTIRDKGLLDAWREGAREWRQGVADKTAAFYPIHEAWKIYPPVGLAADNTAVQITGPGPCAAGIWRGTVEPGGHRDYFTCRDARRGNNQGGNPESPQRQGRGVRENSAGSSRLKRISMRRSTRKVTTRLLS